MESVFANIGASNHSKNARGDNDYYATDPKALELLLELEEFSDDVWECAGGAGHLSEVLNNHGFNVASTDLIDRGYGVAGVDFLSVNGSFDGDIITNPPYKYAKEFVEKALDVVTDGHKVAMFLKLQFLEGKARRRLFDTAPPARIYVSSGRINCYKNGDSNCNDSALAYAWFIWEKGHKGNTVVQWFN